MNIGLYQNCIFDIDFDRLSAGVQSIDFIHNPRPWLREFQIFQDIFEKELHLKHDVVGAVSINFEKKAKLNGIEVKDWIQKNPGYDVYVINPFPQFAYCHFNLWQFSDNRSSFPFTEQSAQSLQECRVEGLVNPERRQSNSSLATCSYWFGNADFWERYLNEVLLRVINTNPSGLSPDVYRFLYEPTYYYANYSNQGVPVGNIAFLLERTLSEFIVREKNSIRSLVYPVDRQRLLKCCLFDFEREIIRKYADYVDDLEDAGNESGLRDYFLTTSPRAAQQWTESFEKLGRENVYK